MSENRPEAGSAGAQEGDIEIRDVDQTGGGSADAKGSLEPSPWVRAPQEEESELRAVPWTAKGDDAENA